jgi:Flp pilus assembly protein CpaB
LAFENKKQILIIAGALIAGVVAVVLTSNYIKSSIEGQTATLAEHFDVRQKEMATALTQRSDQQMAALAQQLEQVKQDQAAAMQKQIAALQQAQAEQARLQAQQAAEGAQKKVHKPSLALKTPPGKRAVTVMIDSLAAVGGLLNAGDFVDVIAQLNVPSQDPDKKTVTAMIFQDLEVLAINTNLDEPGAYDDQQAAGSLKITFAVNPQEAGLLAFANKNGTLELALRSQGEKRAPKMKADTWKTLADYVLKNQGMNIQDPDGEGGNKTVDTKAGIQIFRGGKEL